MKITENVFPSGQQSNKKRVQQVQFRSPQCRRKIHLLYTLASGKGSFNHFPAELACNKDQATGKKSFMENFTGDGFIQSELQLIITSQNEHTTGFVALS